MPSPIGREKTDQSFRAFSEATIVRRSSSVIIGQRAISSIVRLQPRQRLVFESMMQMLLHGDITRRAA